MSDVGRRIRRVPEEIARVDLSREVAIDELSVRREPALDLGAVEHASLESSFPQERVAQVRAFESTLAVDRLPRRLYAERGQRLRRLDATEVTVLERRLSNDEDVEGDSAEVHVDNASAFERDLFATDVQASAAELTGHDRRLDRGHAALQLCAHLDHGIAVLPRH